MFLQSILRVGTLAVVFVLATSCVDGPEPSSSSSESSLRARVTDAGESHGAGAHEPHGRSDERRGRPEHDECRSERHRHGRGHAYGLCRHDGGPGTRPDSGTDSGLDASSDASADSGTDLGVDAGCSVTDLTCDGIDDDCDGDIDDDVPVLDVRCGQGVCERGGVIACVDGQMRTDCSPGAPTGDDTRCDGLDEDCDGEVDDGYVGHPTHCGLGVCAADGVTSCVAGAEVDSCQAGVPATGDRTCDGIDDDCNGRTDDGFVVSNTACGIGACAASGATSCIAGEVVDTCRAGQPAAYDTTCDGIDDDCNGLADDGYLSTSTSCGVGMCAATGSTRCSAGSVVDSCSPGLAAPADVTCDGVDEDCDGTADEDYVSMPTLCGTGVCASTGATSCTNGSIHDSCEPASPSGDDSACNGLDDDCDGLVDESYLRVATTCGVGVCAATGATECGFGSVVDSCVPGIGAVADAVCNGLDDDCDGTVDEDFVSLATACGTGACAAIGATSCQAGIVRDSCAAGTPAAMDATCDGIDDDCNGFVDDGYVTTSTSCGVGVCAATGSVVCSGGTLVSTCVAGRPAVDDRTCDARDDDCDGSVDEDCCSPTTCFDAGAGCGVVSDGCGGTLDCGGCGAEESCVAATSGERICAPATPIPEPSALVQAGQSVDDGLFGAMRFLIGEVQRGVDLSRFEARRAALVRGRVIDLAGAPLEGVRVSVRGASDLGYTYTRADGRYDMLVEGGGSVVLDYERTNRLPVQRRVSLSWESSRELDDVVLIRASNIGTPILFGANAQWASGESVTDSDGTRAIGLYVPSGTHAFVETAGASVPLSGGTLRLTEYTRGERGDLAMPGDLGSPTAYTFAMEAGFDGVAPDARVRFDRPVQVYVDEFLGFPPGAIVPVAYFDRDASAWVPEQDGLVLEVIGADDSGRAILSADGATHVETTDAFLSTVGIDDAERRMLATRFPIGRRFWRVPRTHFSALDFNASRGRRRLPPPPAAAPDLIAVRAPEPPLACGSILACDRRAVAEVFPVAGAPFSLVYSSSFVEASTRVGRTMRIPIVVQDPEVTSVELQVEVLGRTIANVTLPPQTTTYEVTWDGRDAYDRPWVGPARATYRIFQQIPSSYAMRLADGSASFLGRPRFGEGTCVPGSSPCCVEVTPYTVASPPVELVSHRRAGTLVEVLVEQTVELAAEPRAEPLGLGGLMPSNLHRFDPVGQVLHEPLGDRRALDDVTRTASIAVGITSDENIATPTTATPTPATASDIVRPERMAGGPDGSVAFVQSHQFGNWTANELWLLTVARALEPVLSVTETPDRWRRLNQVVGINPTYRGSIKSVESSPDGSWIFMYEAHIARATRRVDGDYDLSLVSSGNANLPKFTDMAKLTERIVVAAGMGVRDDGTVFILTTTRNAFADPYAHLIERLPDGRGRIVMTFPYGHAPDRIIAGPNHTMLVHDAGVIWQIEPDGRKTIFAGGGSQTIYDWNLDMVTDVRAKDFTAIDVRDMALAPDGTLFMVDSRQGLLRVDTNGRMRRVSLQAPATPLLFTPNAYYRNRTDRGYPSNVAITPSGRLFVAESIWNRILEVGSVTSDPVPTYRTPSEDGTRIFVFNASGAQTRTEDARTGQVLERFEYDQRGRLEAITDADGRVTEIERPDARTVVVLAPQRSGATMDRSQTVLHLSDSGYVEQIDDARGEHWAMDLDGGGLLERLWNPRMNEAGVRGGTPYRFTYEFPTRPGQLPMISTDSNPLGDTQVLTSSDSRTIAPTYDTWCDGTTYQKGWSVTSTNTRVERTNGAGEKTTYVSSQTTNPAVVLTVTNPSGSSSTRQFSDSQGVSRMTFIDGTTTVDLDADPWLSIGGRFPAQVVTTISAASGAPARVMSARTTRVVAAGPGVQYPAPLLTSSETTTVTAGTATGAPTRTVTTTYDAGSRTETTTSGLGRTASVSTDAQGRATWVYAPGQIPVHYVYDAQGDLRAIERTDGSRTRRVDLTYDGRGYLASSTTRVDASRSMSVSFPANDAMGFATQASVPNVGTLNARPGADGLVEGLTPPGQPEHGFRYDAIGRETAYAPAGVAPPADATSCPVGVSCTSYDGASRPTRMQHEDGSATTLHYVVGRGLLDSVTVPGDGTYGLTYDSVGRVQTLTGPDGGRVTTSWQSSWPITETYAGTHVVRDSTGATVFNAPLNATLTRTYNEFLEPETLSVSGGYAVKLVRDGDGLLTGLAPVSNTSIPTLTLARDPQDGRVTGTTAGVVAQTFAHDISSANPGFGDLLGQTVTANGSAVYEASYGYDDAGRIVSWTETNGGSSRTRQFDYDDAGRLVGVRDGAGHAMASWTFDGNGNRTSAHDARTGQDVELGTNLGCDDATTGAPLARAATAQDQLCRYGEWQYAYDGNGRLRTRTHVVTGQTLTLTYDAAGRLHEARTESGKRVVYLHDPQGRRIGRVVDGVLERAWVYGSALAPIAELDAAGRVTKTYVYASHVNVPDLIVMASGTTYRVVTDHLGSVRAVVDTATGAVVHRMDFDEWGNVLAESGDTTLHPFGFAGGLYDRDTGLTRFGARDYEPGTGRWTAKDPIGFGGGDGNLYGYAARSPQAHIDPSGKDIWIEGPSGNEVVGHRSVNIGDPNGSYQSWSFGIASNGWGRVYEDIDHGGEIVRYMRSNAALDAMANAYLESRVSDDNAKWYGIETTCRGYSQSKFDEIRNGLGLSESPPPIRAMPGVRSPNFRETGISSGITSSTAERTVGLWPTLFRVLLRVGVSVSMSSGG